MLLKTTPAALDSGGDSIQKTKITENTVIIFVKRPR